MNESLLVGLFTIAGTIVGYSVPALTAYFDRRERERKLIREKFEEMCNAVLQSVIEVQTMMNLPITKVVASDGPVAMLKAHYLAMVYFPELSEPTMDYNNAIATFRSFCIGSLKTVAGGTLGACAMGMQEFPKFYNRVRMTRARVEMTMEKHAHKYGGAKRRSFSEYHQAGTPDSSPGNTTLPDES